MASRYGPGVLPQYYGGDVGAEIADAIGDYIQLKRQQRFDDLAAKGQELDLYRGGYRPEAPLAPKPEIDFTNTLPSADEVAAAISGTPAPRTVAVEEPAPSEAAASTLGQMMAERHRAQDMEGAAMPARDMPPATPPSPAALAHEQASQFFRLANGGFYVPGASEQDRRLREAQQYDDRVRREANARADRLRVEDRDYEERVRAEEVARALAKAEEERAFQREQARTRFQQEQQLIHARGAEARRTDAAAAKLKAAAAAAAAAAGGEPEHDADWKERRASAVALLGRPLTQLQQDIVDALADGETPERILAYMTQQGADQETLAAARMYLAPGTMGYRGQQSRITTSGQF